MRRKVARGVRIVVVYQNSLEECRLGTFGFDFGNLQVAEQRMSPLLEREEGVAAISLMFFYDFPAMLMLHFASFVSLS